MKPAEVVELISMLGDELDILQHLYPEKFREEVKPEWLLSLVELTKALLRMEK